MYALDQLQLNEREEVERMIVLFSEVRTELENIQHSLEMHALSKAIQPHSIVKEKIKDAISKLEKEKKLNLQNLPSITNFSDHQEWLELVRNLIPEHLPSDQPFFKILRESNQILQVLVVSQTDFDEIGRAHV